MGGWTGIGSWIGMGAGTKGELGGVLWAYTVHYSSYGGIPPSSAMCLHSFHSSFIMIPLKKIIHETMCT